ncbi:type VII secretion protein EccB [Actinoplanes sp. NPDC051859]|uniref:type VII secretion protein EccB n=1 Tax=Actinoplanes sp. NPDC051859 TaxID=3363909 RepID=UPI0037A9972C
MQTQRDHVHAHQFLMGRMSNALVLGDPDTVENPFSRAVTGLLAGILIAILVVAGFGIYGWLVPGGSKAWQQKDAIVVEKESGTAYVYLDGALHPTMNMASARLIQGAGAKIQLTARRSIQDVPRGGLIGIPGAPQVLPDAKAMLSGPWLTCPDATGTKFGINLDARAPADPFTDDRFAMVAAGGSSYLIWRGRRHQLTDQAAPAALGLANVVPVPVPPVWLNLLPEGEPVRAPQLDGAGQAGATIAGKRRTVGTLFRQPVAGGAEQLFVLRQDGLSPINATQFAFVQADRGDPAVDLVAADVVAAPRSTDRSLQNLLPDLAAARWEDPRGRALCQRQRPTGPETLAATLVFTGMEHAARKADGTARVRVPPGSALVAYPVPLAQPGQIPDPYLISDAGLRHLLPKGEALGALGIGGDRLPMPESVLTAIGSGPDLYRDAVVVAGNGG